MRIGHGYDVHKLTTDRELIIGGVTIPYSYGCEAHSDGDVLIHAICDALLGAAGLRDIGHHFPDDDNAFKNMNSRKLLKHVVNNLDEHNWQVANVDSTIVAQAPKMAPYIPVMREKLAEVLGVDTHLVNIKATTTEKLGFAGRQEGIAAHAVALIVQKINK